MHILSCDATTKRITPESEEELWLLHKLITPGSTIKAQSFRRFRPSENHDAEVKKVHLTLSVEQVEYVPSKIRVQGKIIDGYPEEFIQRGSYHTIDLECGRPFELQKSSWSRADTDLLHRIATEGKKPLVRLIALDEKKATFATLSAQGITQDFEIYNRASKRDAAFHREEERYFTEIISKISSMPEELIVIAGPGFAKDTLKRKLQEHPLQNKKIFYETCSTAEISGLYELLRSGKLASLIGERRIEREHRLLEEFLARIARDEPACYGLVDVRDAAMQGRVETLLISDSLACDTEGEHIIMMVEKQGGTITIFDTASETGKKLKQFGGIAALLRY